MRKFLRYYLWELENELYACFYFVAMLCMYSIEVMINGSRSVDIFVMFEMLMVSYILAVVQKLVIHHENNYNHKQLIVRAVVWIASSLLIIFASSIVLHWFDHLQTWAFTVFMVYMFVLYMAMWFAIYIINLKNTRKWNDMLKNYQDKSK